MPDKSTSSPSSSPFAGLGTDKALLRSTQRAAPMPEPSAGIEEAQPVPALPTSPPTAKTRKLVSTRASKQASTLASSSTDLADVIEAIRRVVKVPGKEVSFVRLTPDEKGHLADIVYTYKRRGRKTTENEINRIAVNFILEDYHANGEASVLARVLEALRA